MKVLCRKVHSGWLHSELIGLEFDPGLSGQEKGETVDENEP